jgi:hypothetical protein
LTRTFTQCIKAWLARRSHIRISKTRVRHYFRRRAEFDVKEIDWFRDHLAEAHEARQRSVDRRASGLSPEAQEFLADELWELDIVARLADQLSIVALYSVVELNTGLMLAYEFGKGARKDASYVRKLSKRLKTKGIDLKTVPHYRAFDELRLLNNAVKHAGRVTKELAAEYPRWKEGKELTGLDRAYERLRPKVPAYIFSLAQRMRLRYK